MKIVVEPKKKLNYGQFMENESFERNSTNLRHRKYFSETVDSHKEIMDCVMNYFIEEIEHFLLQTLQFQRF